MFVSTRLSGNTTRARRGIALITVLVSMTALAALIAGAFWLSVAERRMGDSSKRMAKSFGIAELGVNERMRDWNSQSTPLVHYPLDSMLVPVTQTSSKTGAYRGKVYRLNSNLVLVEIEGSDTLSRSGKITNGARQKLGMLMRINAQNMNVTAALTTPGKVKIMNETTITGGDSMPAGWPDCPPQGPAKAGVRTDDGSKILVKNPAVVTGSPDWYSDPNLNNTSTTTYNIGGLSLDSLIANADVVSADKTVKPMPNVVNGNCITTDPDNWGAPLDPNNACFSYFPVIYNTGNVKIQGGGSGQGILIIDGNLEIKDDFKFYGIIIVFGKMKLGVGGSLGDPSIMGTVLSLSKTDLKSKEDTISKTTIKYSSCAVMRALNRTANSSTLRSRSWIQMF